MTQKRLRLAHQATDANACPAGTVAFPCASPSRLSCAGVIQTPVPLWVAKRIQSPPKSVASIGIPCTMRFADLASGYRYSNVMTTQKFFANSTARKKNIRRLCSLRLKTQKLRKRSEKSDRMFFLAISFGWKFQELAVARTSERRPHRGEPLGGGCPPCYIKVDIRIRQGF